MSKFFVACTLLLCVGFANATWPYCRCIDYDTVSSPWVVKLQSTSAGSSSYTATFTLVDRPEPANPTDCYKRIKATGTPKIEIDTSYACLAAGNKPTVTINGSPSLSSGAVAPPNFFQKAAVKIAFKPNYKGGPLTFTVTGYGACANWNTLFNSGSTGSFRWALFSDVVKGEVCCPSASLSNPPPLPIQPSERPAPPVSTRRPSPPPPGATPGFPWCRCDTRTANTPYRVIGEASSTSSPANVVWVTFTLGVVACDESKPSCTFDLDKVEAQIRQECVSSFYKKVYITPKGGETQARTLQFQSYGPGKQVMKVTRIGWDKSEVAGATIAVGVINGSKCTWDNVAFPNKAFAFYSSNQKYCPIFYLG